MPLSQTKLAISGRTSSVRGLLLGPRPITSAPWSQPIEGTSHAQRPTVHDVQLNHHRRPDVPHPHALSQADAPFFHGKAKRKVDCVARRGSDGKMFI